MRRRFAVGDRVVMGEEALANYGERYRGRVFVVESVSTKHMPSKEFFDRGKPDGYHPGFNADSGSALYDLRDLSFSLYDWELAPDPAARGRYVN